MKDLYKIYEEKEKLAEYLEWDGPTSQTECDEALLQLANYPDYMSDEMAEAVTKEILDRLQYYENNTEFEEKTETVTRTFKELVHR